MFKCLNCKAVFEEPKHLTERHGFSNPPFEDWYVCPKCKETGYKPLIRNEIGRREMLSQLVDIMRSLNEFEHSVCDALNSTALDDTEFDVARSDLFELIISVAGSDEFELPNDIDAKIFDMRSDGESKGVYEILTKNIEEV